MLLECKISPLPDRYNKRPNVIIEMILSAVVLPHPPFALKMRVSLSIQLTADSCASANTDSSWFRVAIFLTLRSIPEASQQARERG